MNPFFSVVIPLYNKEDYIEDTLQSVLNQTFQDFEVIIIDDGSTDNSLIQAQKIKDSRITFLKNSQNKGLSETRNIGIHHAKGQVIALLDADDIWLPSFLQNIKDLHDQYSEASIYATDYTEIHSNKNILESKKNISLSLKNKHFLVDDFFTINMYNPILCPSSTAFKKSIINTYHAFDASITFAEDIDFYIKYCYNHKVAYYNKALIEKKLNVNGQITSTGISDKKIPNLNTYESWTKNNCSLKKYLDLHRYIFSYQYKLEKNYSKQNAMLSQINYNNLNLKQKFILKSPRSIIILLRKIKFFLLRKGIRITSL